MTTVRFRCENGHVFKARPQRGIPEKMKCSWCGCRVRIRPLPPELQFNARTPDRGRYYALGKRDGNRRQHEKMRRGTLP